MIVRHIHSNSFVEREVNEPVATFLRSSQTWFSQFSTRQTRYEGWFLGNSEHTPHTYYKILERISLSGHESEAPSKIITRTTASRLEWGKDSLIIAPVEESGLIIASDRPVPLSLSLDMRQIYSYPGLGRSYEMKDIEKGVLITYSDDTLERPLFLHIRADITAKDLQDATWKFRSYPRDAARNSGPDVLYTYELPPILATRINLGCGLTREEAITASATAETAIVPQFIAETPADPHTIARHTVSCSLQFLSTKDGVYAGFPWFHQFWSRDELITALGLPEEQQMALILRYLNTPLHEGELPTFIGSGTTCADGVGWLALLIREYGITRFEPDIREKIKIFFTTAIEQLELHRRTPSGLIYSGYNATWMDTIGRTGFRIDIQCMYALSLDILYHLTESDFYEDAHRQALATIHHYFYKNGWLLDGLNDDLTPDTRVRPNIFIAYLLQPMLLTSEEWTMCFKNALQSLTTSWGGLTSLGKHESEFQPKSTGEDNKSYHQGDSWFFVNNLAALALKRLCNPEFDEIVSQILQSSIHEILWQHFLGMPGEIASAKDGASWGCGIQGFSGGAFLKAL